MHENVRVQNVSNLEQFEILELQMLEELNFQNKTIALFSLNLLFTGWVQIQNIDCHDFNILIGCNNKNYKNVILNI